VNYAERQASQFSPHVIGGGGIGRRVAAIIGQPARDPDGVVEAWLATLPYTAGQVQPRRDVIGRPEATSPDGPAALVPIRASREEDAPVIAAFRAGGTGLPRRAPASLRDPDAERTVRLTREQQARWQVVFGQALSDAWASEGRPRRAEDLEKIERGARERARDAVLRR
jgi:hypothetical protein